MKRLAYNIVDVFTAVPYKGNPLAICTVPEGEEVPFETLQAIAREFNLSETVFLHAPDGRNSAWRVRIFTPYAELPFAGHPIIGTAYHIFRSQLTSETQSTTAVSGHGQHDNATVRCRAGDVTISVDSAGVNSAVIPHNFHLHAARLNAHDIEGVQPGLKQHRDSIVRMDLVSPVRGMNFLLTELFSLDALSSTGTTGLKPPMTLDDDWNEGFIGTAYYVAQGEQADVLQYRTRMIETTMEDPATGSMSCGLAMLIALTKGQSAKFNFVQGVEMGRESHLGVELELDHGKVSKVVLKGEAVQVMEGSLQY